MIYTDLTNQKFFSHLWYLPVYDGLQFYKMMQVTPCYAK